jgi:hypothetical protein
MIDPALLDRLREADPETWTRLNETEIADYSYDSDDGDIFCYIYFEQLNEVAKDAWLQHVLQEAIREKGWAFQQTLTFQGTPFAKIAFKNKDGSKHFMPDEHGSCYAEALMRAYLEAIKD